jgi:hypothetical protein
MESLSMLYPPEGEGNAFITRIGRCTFVMNTCENRQEPQTFKLASVPAAVRQFEVARQDNGFLVKWPFRERDLSYKVYRKVEPETRFTPISAPTEERQFLDSTADLSKTVAYSVTALTDGEEPYEGVVNYGEYLTLSNVESRIAEEAIVTPLLTAAQSKPVESGSPAKEAQPWWPNMAGVPAEQAVAATAIVKTIEAWDRAFVEKNLNGVLALYSPDYEDAQGWKTQYVKRAYKWFFEHYTACWMARQIRQWDFRDYAANGKVGVLLYCNFSGTALTDPSGHTADLQAWFPRTPTGEVWVFFIERENQWTIATTNPALPNFSDILSFSASPFDNFVLGPDAQ